MPYKLSEKQAKVIKTRLDMGISHNKKNLQEPFARALRQYTGEHYPNMRMTSKTSRIVINLTLHVIETRVASTTFRYPRFVITPQTPLGEGQEPIVQANLKYYWRKGGVQDELRRSVKDKEVFGAGVCLTGWLFETEDGATVDDGGEERPRNVRKDQFFAKRIFPGNFLISPECGRRWEEAQWMGYWELVPLEEVKKNPHYSNTRQLKGNAENLKNFFPDYMADVKEEDLDPDVKRVKLFHYYERARRIHVVMSDEHDKPLYAEEWGPGFAGRYPFRYQLGPGDEDKAFGQSMALLIEHPQREINEARSQLSNHRKMAVPKYQCGPATLTDKARTALKSYDPLAIVEHNHEEHGAIVPIAPHSIQPEVYKTDEVSMQDIQSIAAVSQYALGNAPTKRTPTAEVNQIAGTGGARAQNDQQAFETFCAEVATDCIAWLKVFAVKTRMLPIYQRGTDARQWVSFTRDQIAGEFDIEVAAHSTAAPNDADQLQSVAFFLQSIMPLIQLIPVAQSQGINLMPLVKQMLKALPDIEDVDEILQGLGSQNVPGVPGQPGQQQGAFPAVMGPAGGQPFAQPALGPAPPQLLAALGINGGG